MRPGLLNQEIDPRVITRITNGGAADLGQGDRKPDLGVGGHPVHRDADDAHDTYHLTVDLHRYGQRRRCRRLPFVRDLDALVVADVIDRHRLSAQHLFDVALFFHLATLQVLAGNAIRRVELQMARLGIDEA